MGNKRFEIKVKEKEGFGIYCVDSDKNLKGYYKLGFKHYMSDWELWNGKIGKLEGELKKSEKVIIKEGKIEKKLEIIEIKEVNINEKIKDPYIAGFDRPIFKPNILN